MKKPFNLKKWISYAVSFFGYLFLTLLDENFSPYALSLLVANLYVGLAPVQSFLLFSIPFLFSFDGIKIACALFSGAIIMLTFLIYGEKKAKPKFEIVAIYAVALTPYCIFHPNALPLKLIVSGAIILSSFIMAKGARVILIKGLKYKLDAEDFSSAVFTCIFCAYGAIIAFGEGFYLAIALTLTLFTSSLIGGATTLLIGVITAIPLALFRLDFTPISVLALYSLGIMLASNYSKLLTALYCALLTAVLYFFTDFLGKSEFTAILLGIVFTIYLFFSDGALNKWKQRLKIHKADNLNRYLVNAHRNEISSKLFETSAVFDEMARSLDNLKTPPQTKQQASQTISSEISEKICLNCKRYHTCTKLIPDLHDELNRIVFFGLSKGCLNFVDLPKSFSNVCHKSEAVVDFVIKRIKEYLSAVENKLALNKSRDLMSSQTTSISHAIKHLAVNFSKQLVPDLNAEQKLISNLAKYGISVKELSIFAGEETEEIITVLESRQAQNPALLKAIDEIQGYKSIISDNNRLSEELSALKIVRRADFDAVFGLARKIKSGSEKSGDTHSIFKITESKFLAVLSDGMGSGERAEETSSSAISLVETFYKAGLDSNAVLPIVNKLLTLSCDDNFTAMDICSVNLLDCSADFVKIGSPYSFILTKDTVKIIEGGSLPLGILDEISPTVCKANLNCGDVIILVSDGVSDAFGSSSDLVEFLSLQKALNPQTLADRLIERALMLDGGDPKDDMTAFCIRIFKR